MIEPIPFDQRPQRLPLSTITSGRGDTWEPDSETYWKGGCSNKKTTSREAFLERFGYESIERYSILVGEGVVPQETQDLYEVAVMDDIGIALTHEVASQQTVIDYQRAASVLVLIAQIEQLNEKIQQIKESRAVNV